MRWTTYRKFETDYEVLQQRLKAGVCERFGLRI